MSKASSVVAIVSRNSLGKDFHSPDRVQRTPKGHMSSDNMTKQLWLEFKQDKIKNVNGYY